jgi:hypothetical protein
MNDAPRYGPELIIRDKKKMTRKQYWEWLQEHSDRASFINPAPGLLPQVEARYTQSFHPMDHRLPAMHPDGSIFYHYVEGSRREF